MSIQLRNDVAAVFGLTEPLGRAEVQRIVALPLSRSANPWFDLWADHVGRFVDLRECDHVISEIFGWSAPSEVGMWTFAAQTFAAVTVDAIEEVVGLETEAQEDLLSWYRILYPDEYAASLRAITCSLREHADVAGLPPRGYSDLVGDLFQRIFPPSLRHLLGEYYTPGWVVRRAASLLDPSRIPAQPVIMDPAAGSGSFIVNLYALLSDKNVVSGATLVLADVSPIAVRFARSNLRYLAKHCDRPLRLHVHMSDTIVDELVPHHSPLFANEEPETELLGVNVRATEMDKGASQIVGRWELKETLRSPITRLVSGLLRDRFNFNEAVGANIICGNPPWISWDGLEENYRKRVAAQWVSSTLITNSGWRAKVAAGKQDVSSLFVYRGAERHAARDGQMVFALPISLFQSRHAGAGFRRFRPSSGRPYSLAALVDLSKVSVFQDALNRTALAHFVVDEVTSYPIPYTICESLASEVGEHDKQMLAQPMDKEDALSPIAAFSDRDRDLLKAIGKSDYRARGGVNTGGANGVLWVDLLERDNSSGLARVRNTARSRGTELPVIEGWVEEDALAPLLVGRGIAGWRAEPSRHIVLLYDPSNSKHAMPERLAKQRFPKAFEYLSQFEHVLKSRREYHRWGGTGPFYEVYRIGPYTFSKTKVVWQHTGFRGRLKPAVLSEVEGKMMIPDQKVILLAFDGADEAHYACAYLSSTLVADILKKYIGLDASTHILDYVGLRRFEGENPLHLRLSDLSRQAHERAREGEGTDSIEREIDGVVRSLIAAR